MHADRTTTHPRGIVSLLSLILMTTVTVTAVGAAAIIISELRQTESLDQSFTAVSAAEAGLEDGLYIIKSSRATKTLGDTITLLNPTPQPARSVVLNGSTWRQQASYEEQFLVSRLPVDTSAHLDLFDLDDAQGGSGMARLEATWGVNCDKYMQMEVTALTWDPLDPFDSSDQQVFKQTFACNQAGDLVCDTIALTGVAGHGFLATQPYRMSFRVLVPERCNPPREPICVAEAARCFGENLQVTAFAANGDPIELPNRIVVRSTGRFSRSSQSLTASVPWRPPISGLFGFVVFSDTDLKK